MEKQTKARLIELIAFFIGTFVLFSFFNYIDYSDRTEGFIVYVGFYIGQMLYAMIISLSIALISLLFKKSFLRILLNSLWISAAITFLILRYTSSIMQQLT